jgi:hypothetical protein
MQPFAHHHQPQQMAPNHHRQLLQHRPQHHKHQQQQRPATNHHRQLQQYHMLKPSAHEQKMKMIYNNTRKLDRLLSNGHQLLSH